MHKVYAIERIYPVIEEIYSIHMSNEIYRLIASGVMIKDCLKNVEYDLHYSHYSGLPLLLSTYCE